jgi:hypothetical protein
VVSPSKKTPQQRAAERVDWPVRLHRLTDEPPNDLKATTTAGERVAMVWPITLDAWASAGRPLPQYERHEMPVRLIRPETSSED